MTAARELDDLRWINDALADGEARIKKQREIIADLGLLGADSTRAKTVLDAMLSAQAELNVIARCCFVNTTASNGLQSA